MTAVTMDVHPALAFVSVIIGATLLGAVGALLALPATAIIKAVASTYLHRHELIEELIEAIRGTRRVSRPKPPSPVRPYPCRAASRSVTSRKSSSIAATASKYSRRRRRVAILLRTHPLPDTRPGRGRAPSRPARGPGRAEPEPHRSHRWPRAFLAWTMTPLDDPLGRHLLGRLPPPASHRSTHRPCPPARPRERSRPTGDSGPRVQRFGGRPGVPVVPRRTRPTEYNATPSPSPDGHAASRTTRGPGQQLDRPIDLARLHGLGCNRDRTGDIVNLFLSSRPLDVTKHTSPGQTRSFSGKARACPATHVPNWSAGPAAAAPARSDCVESACRLVPCSCSSSCNIVPKKHNSRLDKSRRLIVVVRDVLLSHAVSRAVPSALEGLTSGFGMEPGVPPPQ